MIKKTLFLVILMSISTTQAIIIKNETTENIWVRVDDAKRLDMTVPIPMPIPGFHKIKPKEFKRITRLKSIKEITFLHVEKEEETTGTILELRKKVFPIVKKYSPMFITIRHLRTIPSTTEYNNEFVKKGPRFSKSWTSSTDQDKRTISIPVLRSFVYKIKKPAPKTIALKSWEKVVVEK